MPRDDDEYDCRESAWSLRSIVPVLLAAGTTTVLGYVLGRNSFANDVNKAIRAAEESPGGGTLRIWSLL
jgi:hypothetical protein